MIRKFSLILGLVSVLAAASGCGGGASGASSSGAASGGQSAASGAGAQSAPAPNYPTQTIQFVVPTTPGGGFDNSARIFSKYWSQALGQKIVVVDKPGAQMMLGATMVYKAKPDGYHLVILNIPGNLISQVIDNQAVDFSKFQYIGQITESSEVGWVLSSSKVKSMKDLEQLPKVRVAGVGFTTTAGIAAALTSSVLHMKDMSNVNHKGSAGATLSLLRGDTNFMVISYHSMYKYYKAGKLRPIIAYSTKRLAQLPNVPSATDLGYPALAGAGTLRRVVAAPPGTPKAIVDKLRKTFEQAAQNPKFAADFKQKFGADPVSVNGTQTTQNVLEALKTIVKYKADMQAYMKK